MLTKKKGINFLGLSLHLFKSEFQFLAFYSKKIRKMA